MSDPCPECGLRYLRSSPDDRRYHRRYHADSVSGPKRHALPTDHVVWSSTTKRIIVVTPSSQSVQRRRAQDLSLIAARDVPFSGIAYHANEAPDDRNLHIFIGSDSDRLVAYLAFEQRAHVWRCTWQQWAAGACEKLIDHPPMWSVGAVWVCRDRRRQGWVRTILAVATKHVGVHPDQYGWHTPFSDSGEAMVRVLCPDGIFVVA